MCHNLEPVGRKSNLVCISFILRWLCTTGCSNNCLVINLASPISWVELALVMMMIDDDDVDDANDYADGSQDGYTVVGIHYHLANHGPPTLSVH